MTGYGDAGNALVTGGVDKLIFVGSTKARAFHFVPVHPVQNLTIHQACLVLHGRPSRLSLLSLKMQLSYMTNQVTVCKAVRVACSKGARAGGMAASSLHPRVSASTLMSQRRHLLHLSVQLVNKALARAAKTFMPTALQLAVQWEYFATPQAVIIAEMTCRA